MSGQRLNSHFLDISVANSDELSAWHDKGYLRWMVQLHDCPLCNPKFSWEYFNKKILQKLN